MNRTIKTAAAIGLAGALAIAGTIATPTPSEARGGRIAAGIGLGLFGAAVAAGAYNYNRPYYAPYGYYGYGGPAYYAGPTYYAAPGYYYGPRYRYRHRHW